MSLVRFYLGFPNQDCSDFNMLAGGRGQHGWANRIQWISASAWLPRLRLEACPATRPRHNSAWASARRLSGYGACGRPAALRQDRWAGTRPKAILGEHRTWLLEAHQGKGLHLARTGRRTVATISRDGEQAFRAIVSSRFDRHGDWFRGLSLRQEFDCGRSVFACFLRRVEGGERCERGGPGWRRRGWGRR